MPITQALLEKLSGQGAELNVLSMHHSRINNLAKQAKDSLEQLLGDMPQLVADLLQASQNSPNTTNSLKKLASGAHNTGASSYENNSEPIDNAAPDTLPLETTAVVAQAQAQALRYMNLA